MFNVGDEVVIRFPQAVSEEVGVDMQDNGFVSYGPNYMPNMRAGAFSRIEDVVSERWYKLRDCDFGYSYDEKFLTKYAECNLEIRTLHSPNIDRRGLISKKDLDLFLRYYEKRGWMLRKSLEGYSLYKGYREQKIYLREVNHV